MMNSTSVNQNRPAEVCPEAMSSGDGLGSVRVSRSIMAVISTCIVTIHQRFVRITSTIGLQSPFRNQGKYNKVVKKAIWPLGTPIFVNIITEMLFTRKYGIPSAKYREGTHHQGLLVFI